MDFLQGASHQATSQAREPGLWEGVTNNLPYAEVQWPHKSLMALTPCPQSVEILFAGWDVQKPKFSPCLLLSPGVGINGICAHHAKTSVLKEGSDPHNEECPPTWLVDTTPRFRMSTESGTDRNSLPCSRLMCPTQKKETPTAHLPRPLGRFCSFFFFELSGFGSAEATGGFSFGDPKCPCVGLAGLEGKTTVLLSSHAGGAESKSE